jgi:hypothetical protein
MLQQHGVHSALISETRSNRVVTLPYWTRPNLIPAKRRLFVGCSGPRIGRGRTVNDTFGMKLVSLSARNARQLQLCSGGNSCFWGSLTLGSGEAALPGLIRGQEGEIYDGCFDAGLSRIFRPKRAPRSSKRRPGISRSRTDEPNQGALLGRPGFGKII